MFFFRILAVNHGLIDEIYGAKTGLVYNYKPTYQVNWINRWMDGWIVRQIFKQLNGCPNKNLEGLADGQAKFYCYTNKCIDE